MRVQEIIANALIWLLLCIITGFALMYILDRPNNYAQLEPECFETLLSCTERLQDCYEENYNDSERTGVNYR
jgi:hypothetical protein